MQFLQDLSNKFLRNDSVRNEPKSSDILEGSKFFSQFMKDTKFNDKSSNWQQTLENINSNQNTDVPIDKLQSSLKSILEDGIKKEKETTAHKLAYARDSTLSKAKIKNLKDKQRILRRLRKQLLPPSRCDIELKMTLSFFDKHLYYFAQNSFEFHRLIGQLSNPRSRYIFLHIVYTFYYADILLIVEHIQQKKEQIHFELEKHLNQLSDMNIEDLRIDMLQRFQEGDDSNEIRSSLVAFTAKYMMANREQLQKTPHVITNILMKLNHKEAILVQEFVNIMNN